MKNALARIVVFIAVGLCGVGVFFSGCAKDSEATQIIIEQIKAQEAVAEILPTDERPIFVDSKGREDCKLALIFKLDWGRDEEGFSTRVEKPFKDKLKIAKTKSKTFWDGECVNGYADGIGAEISPNGEVLIAEYKDKIPRYVYAYTPKGVFKRDYEVFIAQYEEGYEDIYDNHRYGLRSKNKGQHINIKNKWVEFTIEDNKDKQAGDKKDSCESQTCNPANECERENHKAQDECDWFDEDNIKDLSKYKIDLEDTYNTLKQSIAIIEHYKQKTCANPNALNSATNATTKHNSHYEICSIVINYEDGMKFLAQLLAKLPNEAKK
ncbi:hypothetical protein ACWIWK_00705 [Helicobacter sp. 23-1048]